MQTKRGGDRGKGDHVALKTRSHVDAETANAPWCYGVSGGGQMRHPSQARLKPEACNAMTGASVDGRLWAGGNLKGDEGGQES
eukprot:353509-Chlamydomonas_euryale.AAC.6